MIVYIGGKIRHLLKVDFVRFCIEEAAHQQGFITDKQLQSLAEPLKKSGYGQYLLGLLK